MTQQVRSYALRLTGEVAPSLRRSFGLVDREVAETERRVRGARDEQRRLNREVRGVRRGSEEYDRLQRQVADARRETERLTGDLRRQRGEWDRLTRRTERWGRAAQVGAGALGGVLAGVVTQIQVLGPAYGRLLDTARRTGLEVEQLQRIQLQAQAAGFELDVDEFREINIRLGEARAEAERAAAEGRDALTASIGAGGEAIRDLGLDATQITARDLPAILDRLGELDRQRREFFAEEIFGGTLAERLVPAIELPPELRAQLEGVRVSTEETAMAYQQAYVQSLRLRRATGELSASLGVALAPALTGIVEGVTPVVNAFGAIAERNPAVIQAIVGVGAAMTALIGVTWALNAALAVRAALSGPAGWAALAVAAGVGLTVGGAGYLATRELSSEREAERDSLDRSTRATATATEMGAYRGTRDAARDAAEATGETLRNILPARCPEEGVADAVRMALSGAPAADASDARIERAEGEGRILPAPAPRIERAEGEGRILPSLDQAPPVAPYEPPGGGLLPTGGGALAAAVSSAGSLSRQALAPPAPDAEPTSFGRGLVDGLASIGRDAIGAGEAGAGLLPDWAAPGRATGDWLRGLLTPPRIEQPLATAPSQTIPLDTPPRIEQPLATAPSQTIPLDTPPRIEQPLATAPSQTIPLDTPPRIEQPLATAPSQTIPLDTPPRIEQPLATAPSQTIPLDTPPAAPSYTDARTEVTIQRIDVATADPDEFVAELQAALETARLAGE